MFLTILTVQCFNTRQNQNFVVPKGPIRCELFGTLASLLCNCVAFVQLSPGLQTSCECKGCRKQIDVLWRQLCRVPHWKMSRQFLCSSKNRIDIAVLVRFVDSPIVAEMADYRVILALGIAGFYVIVKRKVWQKKLPQRRVQLGCYDNLTRELALFVSIFPSFVNHN